MPKSRSFLLLLLCCVFSIAALSQQAADPSPECATACIFEQAELPPECDCKTVEASIASSNSNGPSFPNGFPRPSDLIWEAKAQYDARMADIENYYFVDRVLIIPPAGFTMPGFFQTPGVVPLPPVVRHFESELSADGDKEFKEVSPAELAKREAQQQGGDAAALGADPAATLGAFAAAFGALANSMPSNGAGGLAGGAADYMSDLMRQMQGDVTNLEASEDGFGGNAHSDGIGMAIERELLSDFAAGDDSVTVHTAGYNPTRRSKRYVVFPVTSSADKWATTCVSASCGATQESVEEIADYFRYYRAHYLDPGQLLGYVLRLDGRSAPREINWEGRTFQLQYAELWLMSTNGGQAILGEEEELVVARRRMEYVEHDSDLGVAIGEKVVIDAYADGFERNGPVLRPRVTSQHMELGNTKMRTKRLLSRFKSNEGPPTQAEIAKLIADAMQDPYDDPLLDDELVPTYESGGSEAEPSEGQPEPWNSNPATGQTPLLGPGQSPVVRDEIPIIPRPGN